MGAAAEMHSLRTEILVLHSRTEQYEQHVQQNRQLTNSLAAAEHRLATLQVSPASARRQCPV
jgi:hypothetical protein